MGIAHDAISPPPPLSWKVSGMEMKACKRRFCWPLSPVRIQIEVPVFFHSHGNDASRSRRPNTGNRNVVKPSMYRLSTVKVADIMATRTNCTPCLFLTCALISPYHNLSPACSRATLNPGSPSRDRTFILDRYSSMTPAETCFPAQWPRVFRSSRYGIRWEGSFGSDLVVR